MDRGSKPDLLEVERPAKRAKLASGVIRAKWALTPTLPPDAWANVMKYLPLSSVVSLSSVCRAINNDAIPLVEALHIRKASELNSALAKRFHNVRDVFIYSLVESEFLPVGNDDDSDEDDDIAEFYSVNFDTSIRAVPFLSNSFPKLERVFFGGGAEANEEEYENLVPYVEMPDSLQLQSFDTSHKNMSRLIDNISAAFRCNALSPSLSVRGLRCMRAGLRRIRGDCSSCCLAVESFPLRSVVMFESKGSSQTQIDSKRSYDLDVCLSREEIEQIMQRRAGGSEILRSNERLLQLLGRGRRIHFPGSSETMVVYFTEAELQEIDRVIKTSQLDVATFTPTEITEAVMRSFRLDERLPPSSAVHCLFSEKSRVHLNELGLAIEEDLELFLESALKYLNEIVNAIRWNRSIRDECLSLLAKLVFLKESPPIQEVADSGVVSTLIMELVKTECGSYTTSTAVRILTAIMMKESNIKPDFGREEWPGIVSCLVLGEKMQPSHQDTVTTQVIPFIVQAMNASASVCSRSIAVSIVSEIAKRQKKDQIDAIIKADAVPSLCTFLCESSQDNEAIYALSTLSVIAQTSASYRQVVLNSGVVAKMSDKINKSQQLSRDWVSFVHAMVMVDHNPNFLQQVAGGIAFLVRAIKHVNSIQKLAVVDIIGVVLIILQSDGDNIKSVVDAGAIPYIVDCICIPHCPVYSLQLALGGLSIIASASTTYRDDLLKTPVMNHINSICGRLRRTATSVWNNCILLLCSIYKSGENASLMSSISLNLMPLLEGEDDLSTLALDFLERLLREKKAELTETLVKAGIVSRLTVIASSDENRLALGALHALGHIVDSPDQEKVIPEFIGCVPFGLRHNCSERRIGWLKVVHRMVVGKEQNVPVSHAYHSVVVALVEELQPKNNATEAFILHALDVLSIIAGSHSDYRDRLLENGILTCISHHVNAKYVRVQEKDLLLLSILSRGSGNTALAEKIGDFASFLVDMMAHVNDKLASIAVHVFKSLLRGKNKELANAMIKVGVMSRLPLFASDEKKMLVMIFALAHIVDCSTACRDAVVSEIMDHVLTGITNECQLRTAWLWLVYKILNVKEDQNAAVIQSLVEHGVINALVDALTPEKYATVELLLQILDVLSVVAKASVGFRDLLLNSNIMISVCWHLKQNEQVTLQKKCIKLLYFMSRHDKNDGLVGYIGVGPISLLVEMITSEDTLLRLYSLSVCEVILREKKAVYTNAMVEAGIVPILSTLASGDDAQMAQTAMLALGHIMDCSSRSRDIMASEISYVFSGITERCSKRRMAWSILIYKMISLEEGQSTAIIQALVDHNVTNALVDLLRPEQYATMNFMLQALDILSVIAKASVVFRDQLLGANIMKYLCCQLKRKQPALQKKCIMFLHDANISLVPSMCLELAPSLVGLTVSDDKEISRLALSLCENLLRKKHIELTDATVEAGVISKLTHLASTCNGHAQTSLLVLGYIVDGSSQSRDKFVTSEIMGRLCGGIREKSSYTRDSWILLISKLARGQGQRYKNVIQALVDLGVIDALVEFVQSGNQSRLMASVKFILRSAQPHFNERKSIRIIWLQKKRAWLMVDRCHNEAEQLVIQRDSIKTQLDEMRRGGSREKSSSFEDLRLHLDVSESKLRAAEHSLNRLRNDAEKIPPYNTWPELLDYLPDSIEKVDGEITRCKYEVQELRYLLNNASFVSTHD